MKDSGIISVKSEKINKSDIIAAVMFHAGAAVLGFIMCRAAFFEKYMPFGVALSAGCPAAYLPSVGLGVFIGYFFPVGGAPGFRYVAAALAVLAVRFMLSFSKKLDSNPLFCALIAALSLIFTGAVIFTGIKTDILLLAVEVLVCAAATVVISRTAPLISRIDKGLTNEELGGLLIVVSIALAGLYRISFFGITLSGILAVLLILSALKYGGSLAGTVSSVSVSFMLYFASRDVGICFIYTVCALVSGLVISFGKYVELCAFFTCAVVFALMRGPDGAAATFMTEVFVGCALFAVLPRNAGIYLGRIFTCFPQISVNNDLSRAAALRLLEASAGLKEVKETVEEVAGRLEGINTPSFSSVLDSAEEEACGGCKMRINCWQVKRDATLDAVFSLIKQIKKEGVATEKKLPDEFKAKCLRAERFCEVICKRYAAFSGTVAANGRIQQIRQAVGDQFAGISDMLEELAQEFSAGVHFDNNAALNCVTALKNIGVPVDECSAPIDKYGRMQVHLKLKKNSEAVLNKRDIMRVLSLSCERDFAQPVIKKASGETFISISERAALKVDIGVYQRSAVPGDMCGDAYSCFADGTGHFVMILSDGMGTGGRAAVDSAMSAGLMGRLIKSGFGFDCSLGILNSSMLFKSADESLSTIDIASIDLHTGNAELYKAGAAPTVVRRSGRTGKAVSTSMPVGILSDVSFDRAGVKLGDGDILVMMSDGVTFDGIQWVRDEIERYKTGTAQELAERLTEYAARRRCDGHADDITVMAAIIKKAY